MVSMDAEDRRSGVALSQPRAVLSEKDLIERKAKVMKRFLIVVDDLKKLQGAQGVHDMAFDRKLLTLLDSFYEIMGSSSQK